MRVSPLRRSHLGVAAILSLTLTATLIAAGTATPPVEAQPTHEPRFLTSEGEPFEDDLNHYLIRIDSSVELASDAWLQLDTEDHLIAADPQDRVSVQDIQQAVAGGDTGPLGADEIVDAVAGHEAVDSIRPIGFDMYAVAGVISATELTEIAGVEEVLIDTGVVSTSVNPYYPMQWALENDGDAVDPWPLRADADIDAPEGWHRPR